MRDKAFVFSGLSLLLVLPAVILAASFISMLHTGDIATSTALKSDTVYYPYRTVELNFRKTLCNYIYVHRDGNTVDASAVQSDVLTKWVPVIEDQYAPSAGVIINVSEGQLNITFDSASDTIYVGSNPAGRPSNDSAIGITIKDLEQRIIYDRGLGPYALPINCGNPPTSSLTCDDTILLVNAISPADGSSYDTCTNVTISANATTDDCGLQLTGSDASFTALVSPEGTFVTLYDDGTHGDAAADDGNYTGLWLPNATGSDDITITAIHALNGWTGFDTVSNVNIALCGNFPPTSSITSPGNGTSYACGASPVTIRGTASDPDGTVQYVEISTDGGSTWNFANGTTNWNYTWPFSVDGTYNIQSRATDNSNDTEISGSGIFVTTSGCTLPPVSYITSPADGSSIACGSTTISGNASSPNGSITYVEVSTDGGASWNNATGTTLWSYNWTPGVDGNYSLKSRAHDTWGVESPGSGITASVSGCPAGCTNTWSSAPDVAEQFESKNNGAYQLKKSTDPSSSKYESDMGTGCNDQDSDDLKCEEKRKDLKHKRLEFTWYNATMPSISSTSLCSVNLTVKYNLEKNKRKNVAGNFNVSINVTNLQNGVSRLYDIPDTAEDEDQAGNWHDLTIVWPPAPTFSTNDDLVFRVQIEPQADTSWLDNDDEIKLNVAECTDQVQLQLGYN